MTNSSQLLALNARKLLLLYAAAAQSSQTVMSKAIWKTLMRFVMSEPWKIAVGLSGLIGSGLPLMISMCVDSRGKTIDGTAVPLGSVNIAFVAVETSFIRLGFASCDTTAFVEVFIRAIDIAVATGSGSCPGRAAAMEQLSFV